ncbi:MAG: restriction endonuclease subunit S [Verrucomicrobia bacterium]|nr:restriction endonuclease subunit S [Verrucomicrobiota bacterium]
MELRPGYKQTEVGEIPEDWEVATLSELCRSINDGTHVTPRYVHQGVPFYSVENVTGDIFDDTKFISEEEHALLTKRCKPEKGDILLTRIGSLGDTKLLDWDVNASIYVSLALLKLNDQACPEYVYNYSKSRTFVRAVEKRSLLNATPKKINMRDIGGIPIPIPKSLPEQRAIAGALSAVDALISELDQFIGKKRDLKQAAMQQLLTGKLRLPGFSGVWTVKRIGNVAPLQRGFDLPTAQIRNGSYPVVYSNGVLNYHVEFKVKGPGVVTGRSGTIGKVNFVEQDYWPHNTSLWVTDFKGNVPKFIYYLYTTIGLERFGTGSGVPTLNRNDVHAFTIKIPPSAEEQTAIATILTDMDAELAALEQRRDKTRDLKQGMMQELLTGRIRLV